MVCLMVKNLRLIGRVCLFPNRLNYTRWRENDYANYFLDFYVV